MTDIERKTGITDEECEYWDEYFTTHPFNPGPNLLDQGLRPGSVCPKVLVCELDRDVVEYLSIQAAVRHLPLAKIASEMIRREMTTA
jgi:hypothetical protein